MPKTLRSIIVAAASNGVIGYHNRLPWHLPADLAYFKKITYGRAIIMGRTTFESIGKPLLGRVNIILTHKIDYKLPNNCKLAHNLEEALAGAAQSQEIFFIGGSNVYTQALPIVDKIYLTRVHAFPAGDTFFPHLDSTQWQEVKKVDHPADASHSYPYSFIQYIRKSASS